MAGLMNRPSPFLQDQERLSTLGGIRQDPTFRNNIRTIEGVLGRRLTEAEKRGVQIHFAVVDEVMGDKPVNIEKELKNLNLKDINRIISSHPFKQDMKEALQEVFGVGPQIPIYMPHKLNRDSSRLTLGRKPPTKVWSKEELEFYNRKGIATNNLVNIKNKNLPHIFNPLLPSPLLTRESANIVIQKQDFNVSS